MPGAVWTAGTKNRYDPDAVLRNRAMQGQKTAHEIRAERPKKTVMGPEGKKKIEGN